MFKNISVISMQNSVQTKKTLVTGWHSVWVSD